MRDKIVTKFDNYYGVAWNYIEDTYRATGILENVAQQNVEEKLFIHHKIKKIVDNWFIPEFYVHYIHNQDNHEVILEISDEKLDGFMSVEDYIINAPLQSVVPTRCSKVSLDETKASILFYIENGLDIIHE